MRTKLLVLGLLVVLGAVSLFAFSQRSPATEAAPAPDIVADEGNVEWVRVHDVRTGYGPSNDFIDVEVVFKLNTSDRRYGFTLRPGDANELTHAGMLDLLRDAMDHDWRVRVEYDNSKGGNNYVAFRLLLFR